MPHRLPALTSATTARSRSHTGRVARAESPRPRRAPPSRFLQSSTLRVHPRPAPSHDRVAATCKPSLGQAHGRPHRTQVWRCAACRAGVGHTSTDCAFMKVSPRLTSLPTASCWPPRAVVLRRSPFYRRYERLVLIFMLRRTGDPDGRAIRLGSPLIATRGLACLRRVAFRARCTRP